MDEEGGHRVYDRQEKTSKTCHCDWFKKCPLIECNCKIFRVHNENKTKRHKKQFPEITPEQKEEEDSTSESYWDKLPEEIKEMIYKELRLKGAKAKREMGFNTIHDMFKLERLCPRWKLLTEHGECLLSPDCAWNYTCIRCWMGEGKLHSLIEDISEPEDGPDILCPAHWEYLKRTTENEKIHWWHKNKDKTIPANFKKDDEGILWLNNLENGEMFEIIKEIMTGYDHNKYRQLK